MDSADILYVLVQLAGKSGPSNINQVFLCLFLCIGFRNFRLELFNFRGMEVDDIRVRRSMISGLYTLSRSLTIWLIVFPFAFSAKVALSSSLICLFSLAFYPALFRFSSFIVLLLYRIKVYNPGFREPFCKHLHGFWMAGEVKDLVA